tara:strand:+ start:218 stop:445 length:228 start_codon:yes stop_codon:yes gene_type:complete
MVDKDSCEGSMNRQQARQILRESFPCILLGNVYTSYEQFQRKDSIACKDVLDYIQWNQPLPPGYYERITEMEKYQ